MKKDITVIVMESTIQIFFNGEQINIQKAQSEELYNKVYKLAADGKHDEIASQYVDIKSAIESYTDGTFTVEKNQLMLKGDKEPMPKVIATKLLQLKDAKQPWMPLVRFWKKLQGNPDPNVREQLYGFMLHNNIPLTELGDVVVEKGVTVAKNGTLVDCRKGIFDNSIGMVVTMPRKDCDPNPNNTCSHGLHIAAPDYVRNHWSSGTIVECVVDPKDFVAVPRDYNNTKARVCKYKVIGIAKGAPQKNLIVDWDDIIDVPTYAALQDQNTEENKKVNNMTSSKQGDTKEGYNDMPAEAIDFSKMTANKIKEYILKTYGKKILNTKGKEINNKNKAGIVLAADKIVAAAGSKPQQKLLEVKAEMNGIDFTGKSAKEIVEQVKKDFPKQKKFGGKSPRRARVLEQAKKLYAAEKNIKVTG